MSKHTQQAHCPQCRWHTFRVLRSTQPWYGLCNICGASLIESVPRQEYLQPKNAQRRRMDAAEGAATRTAIERVNPEKRRERVIKTVASIRRSQGSTFYREISYRRNMFLKDETDHE